MVVGQVSLSLLLLVGAGLLTRSLVGVLRSERGYTGSQSRLQMLQNKEFVDARVEIFGKHGSRTWVKIGEYTTIREGGR